MEERRVHRRTQVQRQIEIRLLEERPAHPSKWIRSAPGAESTLTPSATTIPGHLVDIGCGGMCAVFAQSLEIGQALEIHIRGAEGPVQVVRGAVRSTLPRDDETFHGLSFDESLLTLGDVARHGPRIIDDHAVKPLVLVVDDEPDVRNMLDKFLTKRGWRVFPAVDADEALEVIKSERPSLMILDLKMPKVAASSCSSCCCASASGCRTFGPCRAT